MNLVVDVTTSHRWANSGEYVVASSSEYYTLHLILPYQYFLPILAFYPHRTIGMLKA
jgi:hypothetical protein